MIDFVHLHVHTQYSILDGQASIPKLVDKAVADGMMGMAVTDHGNMMGIKEFFDYSSKVRKKGADEVKETEALLENDSLDEDERKALEEKLSKARRKRDFMPIFGCEMYCARRGMQLKETKEDSSGWHLIVLAKNAKGYHTLIKLVSRAWTEGLYMRPRTDHADLERYHEGLIVCSACIAGEVPSKILSGNINGAEESIKWFKNLFGDDYYLELQRHQVTDPAIHANRETYGLQQVANLKLIELAQKYQVKLVCTNDVHFVDEENAEAHDRLICLSTGRDLDDPNRMVYTKQEWFKSRSEMNAIFADQPEALENTCEVCRKVEFYSINHGPIMPNFEIPADFGTMEEYRKRYTEQALFEEFTRDENGNEIMSEDEAKKKIAALGDYEKLLRIKLEADYLGKLAYEGAVRRYGEPLSDEVKNAINFELHIMKTMGFPGYFLIVQDYINAARNELDVSVGPGRGSAAGSVVAYCLGITQIDPIKYDLLFERFLNPDRISLPDIDVDFDDDGRARVLQWVTEKYGEENVAHIITYSTMAAKMAIKDVARVQKLPLSESNRLCKLIPDRLKDNKGENVKINLPNCLKYIPELREAEASPDPLLSDTIRYAKMLEGNVRGTGVHACGFIICRDPISDWVPVSVAEDKQTKERVHCTQYEGKVIEDTGLIKMDFLGLKTLSIIREAQSIIHESLGIKVDIDNIDINDPATYQLYCDGLTTGTFQFESAGMQKYLRELQPSTFEDLIAMNALYRPGPMQYIPDFIKRKHGEEPITYDLECMEDYLKDTYGITVYQEQVMLLSRRIANFTRGESDTLRKAMGKKLKDKLAQMKSKFIKGGKKNGHKEAVLEKVWSDWEAFAEYAFNKSHATCYSWVAFQTAYLKAHFPAQYMAAVMSRNRDNNSEIAKLMDECRTMGIKTLIPDVNESLLKFTVNKDGNIRFGMAAVKGVGSNAVEDIIHEREKNGLFTSTYNFFERINFTSCNRKVLENLILSGAFDAFNDIRREQFFAPSEGQGDFLDALIRYGIRFQEDAQLSTMSLFGDAEDIEIAKPTPNTDYRVWSDLERLSKERELIGIYTSAHPLDEYSVVLEKLTNATLPQLENLSTLAEQQVTFGGIVTEVRTGTTKRGKPYGIVKLEDYNGSGEIPLFGNDWIKWQGFMKNGALLFIQATVTLPYRGAKDVALVLNNVRFLSDVLDDIGKINISIHTQNADALTVSELIETLKRQPHGKTHIYMSIIDTERQYKVNLKSTIYSITVHKELADYLASKKIDYSLN